MPSSKGAAVALFVLTLGLAAGNLHETLRRSSIPIALDGTVEGVEVRREKHPGVDDVHLVELDGRAVHLDNAVAGRLHDGDRVQKNAWSRSLRVNDERIVVDVSKDFTGMAIVMPVALAVVGWLLFRPTRPRPQATERRRSLLSTRT